MTGGLQYTASEGAIVTFDLSSPEGQAAFQRLRNVGQLPPEGAGYTVEANIEGSEEQESTGLNFLGVSGTNTNTTSETRRTFTDGHTEEERTGTDATNLSIWGLGSFAETDRMTALEDSRAENRTYAYNSTANSSSTQSVNSELAESTGVYADTVRNELSNQEDRHWTITSILTHAQVEQLVNNIRRGNWNHYSLIYQSGHGADFAEEIRAAGDDWDRIDRALTEFISETGDEGMALIRDTLDISPQYSLTLQGDPYMTGEAGHRALARKIERWTTLLDEATSARTVGLQITTELTEQRERLEAISDLERYPDLPHALRGQEVTRTEEEITELTSLQDRAIELAQQDDLGDQLDTPNSSLETATNASQMTDAQLVNEEWEKVRASELLVSDKRSDCVEMGNNARRAHWIHKGAYAFHHSAYETWGERNWFFADDDHAGEYESAQYCLDTAERVWQEAQTLWREYEESKSRLRLGDSSSGWAGGGYPWRKISKCV